MKLDYVREAQRNSLSGQVLVLFLFLTLFLLGLFYVTMNVGILAEERIKMQVASDSAAMAGARIQSLNLGFVTLSNDVILGFWGKIASDVADAPETLGISLLDIPEQWDNIGKVKKIQNIVIATQPFQVFLAVLAMGRANGADISIATTNLDVLDDIIDGLPEANLTGKVTKHLKKEIPKGLKYLKKGSEKLFDVSKFYSAELQSELEIQVSRPIWTLYTLQMRKDLTFIWDSDIKEKVTVFTQSSGSKALLGSGIFFDKDKKHPPLITIGSAKPYFAPGDWTGDTRSGKLGSGWAFLSTLVPGPWWQERLVATGEMYPFDYGSYDAATLQDFMTVLYVYLGAVYTEKALIEIIKKAIESSMEEE